MDIRLPNDVAITVFGREYAGTFSGALTSEVYGTSFIKLCLLFLIIVVAGIFLKNNQEGKSQKLVLTFVALFFLSYPIGNQPVLGLTTEVGLGMLSKIFQDSSHVLLKKFGKKENYPPGFIEKGIVRTGLSRLNDSGLKRDIIRSVEECIPVGLTHGSVIKSPRPISATDIFPSKTSFSSKRDFDFNIDLIKNREIIINKKAISCYEFLLSVNERIEDALDNNNFLRLNPTSIFGGVDGKMMGGISIGNNKKLDYSHSPFGSWALNTAHRTAILNTLSDYYIGERYDGPARLKTIDPFTYNMAHQMKGPVKLKLEMLSVGDRVGYFSNLNGWSKTAELLHQNNQKRRRIPYYITNVIIILKIVLPLVCIISLVMITFKLVLFWVGIYTAAVMSVWIITVYRIKQNAMLMYMLNIKDHIGSIDSTTLEFEKLGPMFDEMSMYLSQQVSTENAIVGALFAILPAGAVIGSFVGSSPLKGVLTGVGMGALDAGTRAAVGSDTAKAGVNRTVEAVKDTKVGKAVAAGLAAASTGGTGAVLMSAAPTAAASTASANIASNVAKNTATSFVGGGSNPLASGSPSSPDKTSEALRSFSNNLKNPDKDGSDDEGGSRA